MSGALARSVFDLPEGSGRSKTEGLLSFLSAPSLISGRT
jgi:hypothetical protein